MENCIYKIKTIELSETIFDTVCDCTYILLCCGDNPHRLPSVLKNIQILRPTRYVKLIFNKGYKQCPISISVNNDLINAQKFIFNDALTNGFKRIMYLEDDFELENPIEKKDRDEIVNFITVENPSVYGLCNFTIPTMSTLTSYHNKSLYNMIGMTHVMIYNSNAMKNIYTYFDNYKGDKNSLGVDTSIYTVPNISVYRYYKPLIFQKFSTTDNQKLGWKNVMGELNATICIKCVKLLKLDRQFQPGFTIIYLLPYFLYVILLVMIITIVMYLQRKYKHYNKYGKM